MFRGGARTGAKIFFKRFAPMAAPQKRIEQLKKFRLREKNIEIKNKERESKDMKRDRCIKSQIKRERERTAYKVRKRERSG